MYTLLWRVNNYRGSKEAEVVTVITRHSIVNKSLSHSYQLLSIFSFLFASFVSASNIRTHIHVHKYIFNIKLQYIQDSLHLDLHILQASSTHMLNVGICLYISKCTVYFVLKIMAKSANFSLFYSGRLSWHCIPTKEWNSFCHNSNTSVIEFHRAEPLSSRVTLCSHSQIHSWRWHNRIFWGVIFTLFNRLLTT